MNEGQYTSTVIIGNVYVVRCNFGSVLPYSTKYLFPSRAPSSVVPSVPSLFLSLTILSSETISSIPYGLQAHLEGAYIVSLHIMKVPAEIA